MENKDNSFGDLEELYKFTREQLQETRRNLKTTSEKLEGEKMKDYHLYKKRIDNILHYRYGINSVPYQCTCHYCAPKLTIADIDQWTFNPYTNMLVGTSSNPEFAYQSIEIEHTHTFDKNGVCTDPRCPITLTEIDQYTFDFDKGMLIGTSSNPKYYDKFVEIPHIHNFDNGICCSDSRCPVTVNDIIDQYYKEKNSRAR